MAGKKNDCDDFSEKTEESVNQLRTLVKADPELKKYRLDDEYFLQFLYATKFDVPNTLERMKHYQKLLIKYPDWMAHETPIEVSRLLETHAIALLEERDVQNRTIIVIRVANIDLAIPMEEHGSVMEMIVAYASRKFAHTRKNGISVILDMTGLPWKMLSWLIPSKIKISVALIDAYPYTNILIHVINTSTLMDIAIKIVWPFLSENIKNMVKFHFSDYNSLHKYIPREHLPEAYGGTGPNIDYEESNQRLYTDCEMVEYILKCRKALSC